MVVLALVLTFKALSSVFDIITWLPYFILQRPDQAMRRSRRLKARATKDDPSLAWRSVDVPPQGLSTSMYPGCETLPDLFSRACRLYASQPSLGTREVLSEEDETQPNGKVFKKLILGKYVWMTYDDMARRVDNFGAGLSSLGQQSGSKVVVFAETRAEWMISAQACFKNNFPLVTLYATLSTDAITHGINETQVSHVITSLELLPKFKSILANTPSVSHLIVMGGGSRQQLDSAGVSRDGVTVVSMQEVERLGSKALADGNSSSSVKPKPDDLAVVMYTSGSTGLPKGVMISHRNLVCGTSGQSERIWDLGEKDTYIAYLPLAHVLELSAEISCLAKGTRMGYSSPNTLTDKSTKIKKGTQGDVSVLKPTLMAGVPVIMDRIYKNVWENINAGSFIQRSLFRFAYEYKLKHLVNGYDTPLLNKIVFKKTRALLGGRVRLMLCGGAPLSSTTQHFMNVCFCCPVGQGYGLTETCGAGTVLEFSDLSTDRVGPPLISTEIRLRDWTEANYKTSNKPCPQGEVLIGGGHVAMGYYKNPEKTAEDFVDIEGVRYFCAGDVGQFDTDGCLRIIDRKKDLVKLSHGEYIALAQVETVLKMCPVVDQICVVAHSNQSGVVALVVPNQGQIDTLAHSAGVQGDFKAKCEDVRVLKEVHKLICAHGTKSKLPRCELPVAVRCFPDPWMPDTGLVTDAFKLKRKVIEETFQSSIAEMYGGS